MCLMVWRSPHSHCGKSSILHLCMGCAHLPWKILIQLMVIHCLWWNKKPGSSIVGSSMRCWLFTSLTVHCRHQVYSELKLDEEKKKKAFSAAQNVGGIKSSVRQVNKVVMKRQLLVSESFLVLMQHSQLSPDSSKMSVRTENQGSRMDFRVPAPFSWISRSVSECPPQIGL